MLEWVIIFMVISLVAGLLGFSGISQMAAGAAEIIFFFFLILFFVGLAVLVVH